MNLRKLKFPKTLKRLRMLLNKTIYQDFFKTLLLGVTFFLFSDLNVESLTGLNTRPPAKVKMDKNFMGNCFCQFLKNENLSGKNLIVNFSKSPLELHFTRVFDFCRKSTIKDYNLYADVQQRLNALKTFTSSDYYRWDITWENSSYKTKGIFIGQTIENYHWIQLEFENGHVLCFDKFNPTIALYPNRLSLYPVDAWGDALADNPALCCYLIAMPFLNWPIIACEKTAKKGRKAISVYLQQGQWTAQIYLDKHFNTILSVDLCNKAKN